MENKENVLLSTEETAKYLGVEAGTLNVWRCVKRYDLPYIKVGRLVKYRKSDLDAFIEKNQVNVGGL